MECHLLRCVAGEDLRRAEIRVELEKAKVEIDQAQR